MRGVEQIPWLYEIICALYERAGLAEWRQALVAGARGRARHRLRHGAQPAARAGRHGFWL